MRNDNVKVLKGYVQATSMCTVFIRSLSSKLNPLRPNSDLSQTSHCNIKALSVSEVMRIENMTAQAKFY